MLHDGQLAEHLGLVHAQHPDADALPRLDSRDVVQVGRVLAEWALLHLPDEADRGEVHPAAVLILENLHVVHTPRPATPDFEA